jgi:hypothetical protein
MVGPNHERIQPREWLRPVGSGGGGQESWPPQYVPYAPDTAAATRYYKQTVVAFEHLDLGACIAEYTVLHAVQENMHAAPKAAMQVANALVAAMQGGGGGGRVDLSSHPIQVGPLLQMYCKCITNVLQMYYKCITNVLQMFYKCITNVLQMYYKCITNILQMYYKCITNVKKLARS